MRPVTIEWLLPYETYRAWVEAGGLLWIIGKPGAGKLTLLRYAFDHIAVASSIGSRALIFSFFFHNRGVDLQKTPLGLSGSLLHQLLSCVPDASINVVLP
jgi:hypothetical protein